MLGPRLGSCVSKLLGYLVIWQKSCVGSPHWGPLLWRLSKLFGYLVELLCRDPSSVAIPVHPSYWVIWLFVVSKLPISSLIRGSLLDLLTVECLPVPVHNTTRIDPSIDFNLCNLWSLRLQYMRHCTIFYWHRWGFPRHIRVVS